MVELRMATKLPPVWEISSRCRSFLYWRLCLWASCICSLRAHCRWHSRWRRWGGLYRHNAMQQYFFLLFSLFTIFSCFNLLIMFCSVRVAWTWCSHQRGEDHQQPRRSCYWSRPVRRLCGRAVCECVCAPLPCDARRAHESLAVLRARRGLQRHRRDDVRDASARLRSALVEREGCEPIGRQVWALEPPLAPTPRLARSAAASRASRRTRNRRQNGQRQLRQEHVRDNVCACICFVFFGSPKSRTGVVLLLAARSSCRIWRKHAPSTSSTIASASASATEHVERLHASATPPPTRRLACCSR